jgi:hypothetical protein
MKMCPTDRTEGESVYLFLQSELIVGQLAILTEHKPDSSVAFLPIKATGG